MSTEQYRKLINELADFYQAEKSDDRYEVCNLRFANVDFMLRPGEEGDEDGILIYADYGLPPEKIKHAVLQQLMHVNFYGASKRSANFGINPTNGHIIFMNRISVSHTNIDVLINVLAEVAHYITETSGKIFANISDMQEKIAATFATDAV